MTTTPKQITEASNYWSNFRKLPIGNAEMIMHLATFLHDSQNNLLLNLEKEIDKLVQLEYDKRDSGVGDEVKIECTSKIIALLSVKVIILNQ